MRRARSLAIPLVLLAFAASPRVASAQARTTEVPVVVTSVAGDSIYLDKGSTSGIAAGMRVTLRPAARAAIEATIISVSSTSARAELPRGVLPPVPGTPGTVVVPVTTPPTPPEGTPPEGAPPAGEAGERPPPPEHPPWQHPGIVVDPDAPLLAPVQRQRPELRPRRIRGRITGSWDMFRDEGGDRDRTYHTGRLGTWLRIDNPFGKGGLFTFEGDLDYLRSEVDAGFGDETDTLRYDVDRLSYAVGGEDFAPYRLEVGRFYPLDLPEVGPMDGVEYTFQFTQGWRTGLGAGSYLRPYLSRSSGDDLGFHAFVDYQSSGEHPFNATLAFQKTWHDGDADRDLVLGRMNYRPLDTIWLFASWKVDLYTSEDDPKSSGPALTELFTTVNWTPSAVFGGSVSYSHYEWVALERDEFENVEERLIAEGEVDRADARAWWRVARSVRLSGRFGIWSDERTDGTSGDFMVDLTPQGWPVSFDGGVYFTDARYLDGIGYRIRATVPLEAGRFFVGYDQFDYDRGTYEGADDSGTRSVVRSGIDFSVGSWSYDIYGDWLLGDDEDGFRLGAYATFRF